MDSCYSRKCCCSSARDPRSAAATCLEILGHDAVGPVHLRWRCSSVRSRSSSILCCGRAVRSIVARAIRVVGGGLTISLSVILGLPAVLLATWIAIRPTRTPFTDYLALRWTSWRNFSHRRRGAGHPCRRLGPAVAGARTRGDAGLHGRRAEIRAGRRRAVAAGDRVLRRRADVGRDIFARVSSTAAGRNQGSASPARSSCRRWPGPRCICNTTGSSSARCFRIGLLLGYLRYRTNSTWLTIVLHGINNLAATIQTFWLAGSG